MSHTPRTTYTRRCPECGEFLRLVAPSAYSVSQFERHWVCTHYPECEYMETDDGKPIDKLGRIG